MAGDEAEDLDEFGDIGEDINQTLSASYNPKASLQMILEREYKVEASDLGNPDSLVSSILHFVVRNQYDKAITELRAYQSYKSNYPTYPQRTDRIFDHVVNLINAIKSKKQFPNLANLPPPKRQELNEYISHHFKDLKSSLKKILKVEYDLRQSDSHTTLWVVQALLFSIALVLIVAVVIEAWTSMQAPLEMMLNDISRFIYRIFKV